MSKEKIKMQLANFSVDYDVRYFLEGDEIWFVAADVCKILELSNTTRALSNLDEDEQKIVDLNTLTNSKGISDAVSGGWIKNEVNVVNESGLYHLIFQSRKPEAKKFRKWVTSEVLPSIRKTGSYSVKKKEPVCPPEFYENLTKYKIIEEKKLDLAKDNARVRKFKWEHPKYQNCFDCIEYDKITEIPADDELKEICKYGEDKSDWVKRNIKNGNALVYYKGLSRERKNSYQRPKKIR